MDNLKYTYFKDLDLNSTFFDSLRVDYEGFDDWFKKKSSANERAFTYFDENGELKDFLYLKKEEEELSFDDITFPIRKRLKVGTFKIENRHTIRGERFIKKILDIAVDRSYPEVYVTMFDDREELKFLRDFFEKFGFKKIATKTHSNGRSECVLLKEIDIDYNNIIFNYPKIKTNVHNKYLLAIYPEYHTKLFPDSILGNESYDVIQDYGPTNSIYKTYLCWMKDTNKLKQGDLLAIYRTSDNVGPAKYRSVVTSICTVDEIKTIIDFDSEDDFVKYTNKYSIFNEIELRKWYKFKPNFTVIKMLYNIAFKNKVIRQDLIEQLGLSQSAYWGFFRLSDQQFAKLLNMGNSNERYIINQT